MSPSCLSHLFITQGCLVYFFSTCLLSCVIPYFKSFNSMFLFSYYCDYLLHLFSPILLCFAFTISFMYQTVELGVTE